MMWSWALCGTLYFSHIRVLVVLSLVIPSWTSLASISGINYVDTAQLEESSTLGTKGHVDSKWD